jgi:threonine-phosphate decarboxylase
MIEGHGDDGWKYKVPIRADFSSNVFHGELDAGLRAHLTRMIDTVTHYPEAGAASLQNAAAAAYNIQPDSVLVTNGATEAIYLLAQAFRNRSATIVAPTFAEYADACAIQGMSITHLAWEELIQSPATGLIFVCNPNNPTGLALPASELIALADRNPAAILIIDESYLEFTQATTSVLTAHRPNLLVLKSLTKSCRIPGLRAGFLIGAPELITRVANYKMPWSVNRLALEAGVYIFQHAADLALPVASLLKTTTEWRRQLSAATGWRVGETDTHYFLIVSPATFTAAQLKTHLISRHGLLIRDAANFKGLGPHHFRIACQSPEQNQLLTEALRECSRIGIT